MKHIFFIFFCLGFFLVSPAILAQTDEPDLLSAPVLIEENGFVYEQAIFSDEKIAEAQTLALASPVICPINTLIIDWASRQGIPDWQPASFTITYTNSTTMSTPQSVTLLINNTAYYRGVQIIRRILTDINICCSYTIKIQCNNSNNSYLNTMTLYRAGVQYGIFGCDSDMNNFTSVNSTQAGIVATTRPADGYIILPGGLKSTNHNDTKEGEGKWQQANILFEQQCLDNEWNVHYTLAEAANIDLSIYDLQGRCVAYPLNAIWQAAGTHQAYYSTGHLPAGIYIYRFKVNGVVQTGKFVQF